MALPLQLLIIPLCHFMLSVFLVGVALHSCWPKTSFFAERTAAEKTLLLTALGILYNMLQFCLVFVLQRFFHIGHGTLSGMKYASDLALLGIVLWRRRLAFTRTLSDCGRLFWQKDNILVMAISATLGILAILNFPHVHDSIQLIWTNRWLAGKINSFSLFRSALGFSALIYFPKAIMPNIPLTTLAAGFKLPLLLLTGLLAILAMEKLQPLLMGMSKLLFLAIVISSFFGLYGLIQLGKSSNWGVLFSLMAIFSLQETNPKNKVVSFILFTCTAASLGLIAIPYLAIAAMLYLLVHWRHAQHTWSKFVLPALILSECLGASLLLPVKLPRFGQQWMTPLASQIIYAKPFDGQTTFYNYFCDLNKYGIRNVKLVMLLGLAGILILPLTKKFTASLTIRGLALFPTTSALLFLLLTLPARWWPVSNINAKIRFTPLTAQNLWDLTKDLPQWYLPAIMGFFFIFFIDSIARQVRKSYSAQSLAFLVCSLVALILVIASNVSSFAQLRKPANFGIFVGHKDPLYSNLMDLAWRNRADKTIWLIQPLSALELVRFNWQLDSVVTPENIIKVWTLDDKTIQALKTRIPAIVVSEQQRFLQLRSMLAKLLPLRTKTVQLFKNRKEGIFLLTHARSQEHKTP